MIRTETLSSAVQTAKEALQVLCHSIVYDQRYDCVMEAEEYLEDGVSSDIHRLHAKEVISIIEITTITNANYFLHITIS